GRELVAVAHPDQVAGDEAPKPGAVGHDVAPQVGRRGVAVLEDDGGTGAHIHKGHAPTFDGRKLLGGIGRGGNWHGRYSRCGRSRIGPTEPWTSSHDLGSRKRADIGCRRAVLRGWD